MGAGASVSICQASSSVRVLKQSTRVEPEPRPPEPDPNAVFGVPLSRLKEAGKLNHGVPIVLKNMVEFIERYGLQQIGVFRVCGSALRCRTLRVCLDRGEFVDLENGDVPTVATLLKLYLRELPYGLIPNTHSKRMQQALMDSKDGTDLLKMLKETLSRLPDDNYNILSYLLHFLSRVAAHSQWNHMTIENLATVFGPCIFRVPEGPRMLEEQTVCNTLTLHLLEKHVHLIPGAHTRTHSRDFTPPAPPLADSTQLQEEQSYYLGTTCDKNMDEAKNTSTTASTPSLSSRGDTVISKSDETELLTGEKERRGGEERKIGAETEERKSLNQDSSVVEKNQSGLISSDMSPSLQLHAAEPPSPNINNNNMHLHTIGTHSLCSITDAWSDHTHSSNSTHSRTRQTRSKARKACRQSLTHTPNRDTNTKIISAKNAQPHTINTHSRLSHTPSQSSISNMQKSHTPSAPTQTEDELSPASSCKQFGHNSRASFWKADSTLPTPAPNQNPQLNSEQDSTSSSQSQTMCESISSWNTADGSSELSISLLQRHIHNLKQEIKTLKDSSNHNHKVEHDKMADAKVTSLIMDLNKARKHLKEIMSSLSVDGSKKLCSSSTVQQGNSVPQIKPALEDTVKTLTRHLKEKRLELNLPECVTDMSTAQLGLEKITLQKCLLYYESLHGRPRSREERSAVRELYDRYRSVKLAFYTSNTQTRIIGKDEDSKECIQQPHSTVVSKPLQDVEDCNPAIISALEEPKQATPQTNNTHSTSRAELLKCVCVLIQENDEDSEECIHSTVVSKPLQEEDCNPAIISGLEEPKQATPQTNNTQTISRTELLKYLKETREEKKRLKKILKEYEEMIHLKTGRSAQKEDRGPMAAEYDRYKTLKVKLKLLKTMLGKNTHPPKAGGGERF